MLKKNFHLMKMARAAKRAGYPISAVIKGLKPEYQHWIPELEAEYNRFKPRKK